MPRKRKDEQTGKREVAGVMGLRGSVEEQPITETLEINYMPYAIERHRLPGHSGD
ncbi:MAG: hypothetical protein ACLU9S_12960 [Oscillospiraceae bacterium]